MSPILDHVIDCLRKCSTGQDPKSVEKKDDLRSYGKTEGVPGGQARPEGNDADSKESGESEADSTADEEVRVTLSKHQPKVEPGLIQL